VRPDAGFTELGANPLEASARTARSMMLFHQLALRLGEQPFLQGLQHFARSHQGKAAGWPELAQALSQAAGADINPFIQQFLDGRGLPQLKVTGIEVEEKDGEVLLRFALVQENDPPYDLDVPFTVITPGGSVARTARITEKKTQVNLTLPDRPQEVRIDPEYQLLRRLSREELPPLWLGVLAGPSAVVAPETVAEPLAQLQAFLTDQGMESVAKDEAEEAVGSDRNLVILGRGSALAQGLFAGSLDPQNLLSVHNHPLAEGKYIAVADTDSLSNRDQLFQLLGSGAPQGAALPWPPPGLFSRIRKGKDALAPELARTENGIVIPVEPLPQGHPMDTVMDFGAITREIGASRVVYVGETHTDYGDHLLQLRFARAMYRQDPHLAIGMEMFPRAVQPVLDRFITGEIDEKALLKEADWFTNWGFDYRLYRDIILFARKHRLPLVGLNLKKGLTSTVFKQGSIFALEEEERSQLPKARDLAMPGYRERLARVFQAHDSSMVSGKKLAGFIQAQTLWDETMAESISDFLARHPDHRMLVVVGRGHAVKENGIPPRVARRLPGINQSVILPAQPQPLPPSHGDFLVFAEPAMLPDAPLLGVQVVDHEKGARIAGLSETKGKAAEKGIKKDDIIVALDGRPIRSVTDLKVEMVFKKKGETVQVDVIRHHPLFGDKHLSFAVPL